VQPGSPEVRSTSVSSEPPPTIADHELLHVIGRGAYGEVWLARHTRLDALRAVKVVRRDEFGDDRPFRREFEGIQKYEPLSRGHPNLVSILHVGGTDECFYYVMELADGADKRSHRVMETWSGVAEPRPQDSIAPPLPSSSSYTPHTLSSELKQHGALPIDRCLEIGHALASSLAHLHANGLVHRDVKPSNVIFVGGVAKLADIGLVAGVDDAPSFVGTEGYIPPEGPGTPSADCYSLGKLLYELSTGHDRNAWPEPPADLATRTDRERLLEFNAILHRACAPEPRQRYANAEEMLADVELLRKGRSVKSRHAWQLRAKFGLKLGAASAGVAFLVLTGWLLFTRFNSSTRQPFGAPQTVATVAVLPFDDESPTPVGDNLGERLAEDIRANLTRVPGVGILGRSSSAAFKTSPDPLAIARTNRVDAVLGGRVRREGDQTRLSLELTDTRSGRLIWSDVLHGQSADPFALQIAVVERVPEALGLRVLESQMVRLITRPTKNLEAYRAYWEGRHAFSTAEGAAQKSALEHFQKAIQLDPGFALAYAELAAGYAAFAEDADRPPKEYLPPARAAVEKALELAPNLADAHVALAAVREVEYDWDGAETAYRRALQLDPNHVRAHNWYGFFLEGKQRLDEARPHRERALQLDPLSPENIAHTANQLRSEGRLEEAVEKYREAGKLQRHWSTPWSLAETLRALNRDAEALDAYEDHWLITGETRETVAELRAAYVAGGWPACWRTRLRQVEGQQTSRYVQWHMKAHLHALAGNADEAFACMARSIEDLEPFAPGMKTDAAFKLYRSDPRFKELLRKMNLEL